MKKLKTAQFLLLLLLLMTLGAGCRVAQTAADLPGHAVRAVTPGSKDRQGADPVELQQTLLRFADECSAQMVLGVDGLRRGDDAMDPAEALRWKIALVTEISSIAAGPNAFANVLDMTVFVTLTRTVMEHHWQPEVFGVSALPLLESCRAAETNAWQLADTILKPEQRAELRDAIETWYRQNPLPESVLAARAVGIASQVARAKPASAAMPSSVFGLINLDPLSSLDPATRELAQTRLFAERALYLAHRMPILLRWQMELLALNATELPAVQQWVTNSTQIAAAVERFAAVAEKLPGQIRTEREETLGALQSQERQLTPLVKEVRDALTAGSQMSTSLNTTVTTFDALMQRLGVGEANPPAPPNTNIEPFRIQDYQQTAAQLEAAARQLTELLVTFDQALGSTNLAQLSARVGPVVQQAQAGGKEIVDYAFWKGILLVGVLLAAALMYRFLSGRMTAAQSKSELP